MLGDALKLGIQSTKVGVDKTDIYFPKGLWCEVFNRKGTLGCFTQIESGVIETSTKAFEFALHLKQGKIIPMQDGTSLAINNGTSTIKQLQDFATDFHILPNCSDFNECTAAGDFINDDGETINIHERNTHRLTYS